jgi:hypothetical protein
VRGVLGTTCRTPSAGGDVGETWDIKNPSGVAPPTGPHRLKPQTQNRKSARLLGTSLALDSCHSHTGGINALATPTIGGTQATSSSLDAIVTEVTRGEWLFGHSPRYHRLRRRSAASGVALPVEWASVSTSGQLSRHQAKVKPRADWPGALLCVGLDQRFSSASLICCACSK